MTREEYKDKLNDPRWHLKRTEILSKKGAICYSCGETKGIIDLHHRKYIEHGNPWDSPDDDLIPLCRSCHKIVSNKTEMNKLRMALGRVIKHNDVIVFLLKAMAREHARVEALKKTLNV
jgi:5-methylcytosine-specific restriction endonuclease McrA